MPEPSILDARLAEIDRRLRMIQSGLEPVRDLAEEPVEAPPAPNPLDFPPLATIRRAERMPAPPPAADGRDEEIAVLTARLSELTAAHERLLATTQDLLIEQADMLARAAPKVSVAAGPFSDTPALQEFQSSLRALSQVQDVTVREYVGSEDVILDVHLRPPIS